MGRPPSNGGPAFRFNPAEVQNFSLHLFCIGDIIAFACSISYITVVNIYWVDFFILFSTFLRSYVILKCAACMLRLFVFWLDFRFYFNDLVFWVLIVVCDSFAVFFSTESCISNTMSLKLFSNIL